jgi:hypothetical protein
VSGHAASPRFGTPGVTPELRETTAGGGVLLVFAGIWALMEGINDIVRAFEIRAVRDEL